LVGLAFRYEDFPRVAGIQKDQLFVIPARTVGCSATDATFRHGPPGLDGPTRTA
jgi:hypothetical protein